MFPRTVLVRKKPSSKQLKISMSEQCGSVRGRKSENFPDSNFWRNNTFRTILMRIYGCMVKKTRVNLNCASIKCVNKQISESKKFIIICENKRTRKIYLWFIEKHLYLKLIGSFESLRWSQEHVIDYKIWLRRVSLETFWLSKNFYKQIRISKNFP